MIIFTGDNAKTYYKNIHYIYGISSLQVANYVWNESDFKEVLEPQFDFKAFKEYFDSKLQNMNISYPIQTDEVVEDVEYTYFKNDYKSIHRQTPAIIRRTNKVNAYLFLIGDRLDNHKITTVTGPLLADYKESGAFYDIGSGISSLLILLGEGVMSGIAGKAGSLIFDAIFNTGYPNYKEICADIKYIIHSELTQQTISELQGKLDGVTRDIKNIYNPRKKSGESKKELMNYLSPRLDKLREVNSTLAQDRYNEGIGIYMICAYLYINLLQEAAYLDELVDDPHKSSYCKSITLLADEFKGHVYDVSESFMQIRQNYIRYTEYGYDYATKDTLKGTIYKMGYEDKLTGYKNMGWTALGREYKQVHELVINEKDKYCDLEVGKIYNTYQFNEFRSNMWDLLGQPLPK